MKKVLFSEPNASEYGFILSDLKEYLCIIMAISFFYSFRKALKGVDNGD